MSRYDLLIERLDALRGTRTKKLCPAHDDKQPSLSIKITDDGKPLIHCQAGCSWGDILSALAINPRTLQDAHAIATTDPTTHSRTVHRTQRYSPPSSTEVPEAVYVYTDANGKALYEKRRYPGKRFLIYSASGELGMKGAQNVLYNLPAVIASDEVVIVEGEKDADRLISLGFCATTAVNGAKSWRDEYGDILQGKSKVLVLPDNDAPGRAYARRVCETVPNARVVALPGLPEKGDVSDWLDSGHDANDLRAFMESIEAPKDAPCIDLIVTKEGLLRKCIENTSIIATSFLSPQFDVMSREMTVCVDGKRVPLDEMKHAVMLEAHIARHYGVVMSKTMLVDGILNAMGNNTVDSCRDWLDGLKWDGNHRLWAAADVYFGAREEIEKTVFRLWIISAVARQYQPGCQVDHVIVLEGDQGAGKTRAMRILGGQWYSGHLGDIASKDAYQALWGKMIVEIGELDSFKGKSATMIKDFITQSVDYFRPPFERVAKEFRRRCVFAGTTNETRYLMDMTGNRRFWPIRCYRIDCDALERDRDQLFAEAVYYYHDGAEWWTNEAICGDVVAAQDERQELDPWEDILRGIPDIAARCDRVTREQIVEALDLRATDQDPKTYKRIVALMRRIGYDVYVTKEGGRSKRMFRLR